MKTKMLSVITLMTGLTLFNDMAAFAQAFGCKKGDAMIREQACKIW